MQCTKQCTKNCPKYKTLIFGMSGFQNLFKRCMYIHNIGAPHSLNREYTVHVFLVNIFTPFWPTQFIKMAFIVHYNIWFKHQKYIEAKLTAMLSYAKEQQQPHGKKHAIT